MNIESAFPSKYLKAADIPDGQQVPVTIDRVGVEDPSGNGDPDENKPVIYFTGKKKGMVMNVTNKNTIVSAYGTDTDNWCGKPILLYKAETSYAGQMVPCIRMRIPKGAVTGGGQYPRTQASVAAEPKPGPEVFADAGVNPDDIPF